MRTFKVLAETVEKTSAGDSIMEPDIGKEDTFEEALVQNTRSMYTTTVYASSATAIPHENDTAHRE